MHSVVCISLPIWENGCILSYCNYYRLLEILQLVILIWPAKGAAVSHHCFAICPPHQTQTWQPGWIRSRTNKLLSSSLGLVFNLAQALCSLLAWWSAGCNQGWELIGGENVSPEMFPDCHFMPMSFRSYHSSKSICILVPYWLSLSWQFNHFMSFFVRQESLLSTMHFTPETPYIILQMSRRILVALKCWTLKVFFSCDLDKLKVY